MLWHRKVYAGKGMNISMNNFIFENATKVYFGEDCVKEYLACRVKPHQTVMLA